MGHAYRVPTEPEIAAALAYIFREFVLQTDADGMVRIDGEHWAEGLAFGPSDSLRYRAGEYMDTARESLPQFTELQWRCLAAAADRERVDQHMATLYRSAS